MIKFIMDSLDLSEEVAERFVRSYEERSSVVENYFYGTLYKVTVNVNEEGLHNGVIEKLKEFKKNPKNKFIHLSDYTVIIYLSMKGTEDKIVDLEITMDEILNGDEYGSYYWKCISTT